MEEQNYHIRLLVDATPNEVFRKINAVTRWWTEHLTGKSENLNDLFTVKFDDVHVSTQKIIEIIPDQKIAWLVTDSNLNFIQKKDEWTNTKICFEISAVNAQTQIDFTHFGLGPQIECFNACSQGWDYYIKGSLFKLLTEGKGTPELK